MQAGGITFCISCHDASISLDHQPAYSSFFRPELVGGPCDVSVSLVLGDVPDTTGLTKIFDTGESWSLYADGRDFLLELGLSSPLKQSLWVLRFDRSCSRAVVHCGRMLTAEKEGIPTVSSPLAYPMDQFLMMYVLARREGAIIHAAGVEIDGSAYIFPGRSGAGKSTLTRQFVARNHPGLLSDDRIIARKMGRTFTAFGTPWPGDAGIAENRGAPLAGIFFLSQGNENRVEEISPGQAAERLMPLTSIPWFDAETMSEVLGFCDDLLSHIPCHVFHCRPETAAVDAFEEFISREKI